MENREKKKTRLSITPRQHIILVEHFAICAFPNSEQRQKLSEILNISPRSIQIWFQNRRQKAKVSGIRVEDMHSPSCGHRMPLEYKSKYYPCKSLEVLANLACMEYYKRNYESR